jgi:hypothetical protein
MTDSEPIKMTVEDRVIEAARLGFKDANVNMDKTMEQLLRMVYKFGYAEAKREIPINTNNTA